MANATTADARLANSVAPIAASAPQLDEKLHHTGSTGTSKQYFFENAKPIEVTIAKVPMQADVKDFNSGSFGWYLNGQMMQKLITACRKDQFLANAGPIEVQIAGRNLLAYPMFSGNSGSCLWNISEKLDIPVGHHLVKVQVGLNITLTKTKDECMGPDGQLKQYHNAQLGLSLTVVHSKTGSGKTLN